MGRDLVSGLRKQRLGVIRMGSVARGPEARESQGLWDAKGGWGRLWSRPRSQETKAGKRPPVETRDLPARVQERGLYPLGPESFCLFCNI